MTNTTTDTDKYILNGVEVTPNVFIYIVINFLEAQQSRLRRRDARIAELEAAQRWIPVSERLPEANVRVLFCNGNRFAVGWYGTNDDIYEWSCWDDAWPGVTPTHWMPIPQPLEVQE